MKKIMVATDFSERSDRAARRAILLAREHGGAVELVHVVPDDQPGHIVGKRMDEGGRVLAALAQTFCTVDGVECTIVLETGPPVAQINRIARTSGADVLVLGPHRRHVIRDAFIGTTAEQIVRGATCPVLMVNAVPAGQYRRVILTTDLSDASREAVERFATLGAGKQASVAALHVFDAPALRLAMSHTMSNEEEDRYVRELRGAASRKLARFLEPVDLRLSDMIVRNEETNVPDEILRAADHQAADLIVVATRGQSGLARLLLGSVAETVLRTASVDVLAIPPSR